MSFESDYVNLLIKQYWEKPKANAEIAFKAGVWRKTFEWIDSFSNEFDLDNATGDRLDIIGRIVGINRIVPFVVAKIAFGFSENPNARGFEDKFLSLAAKDFNIGENLLAGDLYRLAFNAGESFIPTNLEISRDSGATYTDGRILSDLNEKFSIAAGDVAVTEII